ncbi:MAG: response regulator transcription factor [Porticoccaceae bacterium]|nr:response regulator transcription factor [Porticoccaceae bacterium]
MHVLIVDDHAFVCVGLKATLLDEYQGVTVTTADNRTAALAALENGGIDLVIADLFMPGAGGGFDFIALLCDTYPELPVIVLSASENPAHIRKCLDYGAIGFVTKSAPRNALFDAIKRALNGERYVPESLRDAMPQVAKIMDEVDFGVDVSVVAELITKRQMEILQRVAQGLSNKQIARELELSENTIKVHVSSMLRSLGLANRTQAGILGQKLGLGDTSEGQH